MRLGEPLDFDVMADATLDPVKNEDMVIANMTVDPRKR